MIAFDTNHLLRHILGDHDAQSREVAFLIAEQVRVGEAVRIFDLVLAETCWVLQSLYGFDRNSLSRVIDDLLADPVFSFDDHVHLRKTLDRFRKGKADFSDYLIWGRAEDEGCQLKTFDRKLAKELRV